MNQVRIGLIGCGNIGRRHVSYLEKMSEAKLVAFCDVEEARARDLAGEFSARAYSDYRAMLDKEELEAVYICTPAYAREDQEIAAAARGLHIFLEKPAALSAARAQEIQKSLDKAGVIVSVGYLLRYLGATARAKEILADKKITLSSAWYLGGLPALSWFGEVEKSGGQILDQTSHLLDLLGYLVGEVKSVAAAYGYGSFAGNKALDIADSGVVNLRFANGALGSVTNCCCLGFHGPTPGIWLAGEGFFIELTYKCLRVKTADEAIEEPVDLRSGYEEESRVFLEAVLSGSRERILCPYQEAAKTLATVLAADRSAKEGKAVQVAQILAASS